MDEQKTKVDKGRRRFIKGTAGTALIASAGAVGSGADASPRAADEKSAPIPIGRQRKAWPNYCHRGHPRNSMPGISVPIIWSM